MPPRRGAQRRNRSSNDRLYELGRQGRRTGVTLPDTGQRDEHGLEPVDGVFSSPEKRADDSALGRTPASSEGQDMDLDDASQAAGPATIRAEIDRNQRRSIPRAKSPIKTNLQSPARQNPYLGPTSSPTRGSIITEGQVSPEKPANRRLDFSAASQMKPLRNGHPKVNGSKPHNANLANGWNSDDSSIIKGTRGSMEPPQAEEESMQVLDAGGEDGHVPVQDEDNDETAGEPSTEVGGVEGVDEVEEEIPTSRVQQSKPRVANRPGPSKAREAQSHAVEEQAPERELPAEDEPVRRKRGRSAKDAPQSGLEGPVRSSKRKAGRDSTDGGGESAEAEDRGSKRPRTEAKEKAKEKAKADAPAEPAAAKGKRGRKRKSSGAGVDSPSVIIQKGPPLPKSRGLVTMRREAAGPGARYTRSGRFSTKPLAWWKNERYEYDEENEEVFDDKKNKFKMPTIKDVVRVESVEEGPRERRRGGKRSGPARRRVADVDEEDEEREEWEEDPGHITGEVLYWYPQYELEPPMAEDNVEVVEEELAVSAAAVQFKDVKDGTFRFAKSLSLPFFGSGIVELPPGSEKRPKNARKMQMVFFVHYGNVQVTVAETTFRIGKGGMWFVPRGNQYSIENHSDRPAQVFFCQGCEQFVQPEEAENVE